MTAWDSIAWLHTWSSYQLWCQLAWVYWISPLGGNRIGEFNFLVLILNGMLRLTRIKDEKVCFSTVGGKCPLDSSVSFLDCQESQVLYHTLLRVSLVLDSCIEVAKGCEEYFLKLASLDTTILFEPSLTEIKACLAQMKSHRRNIYRVTQQCKGTSRLVCSNPVLSMYILI